jgi:hypothetical protein
VDATARCGAAMMFRSPCVGSCTRQSTGRCNIVNMSSILDWQGTEYSSEQVDSSNLLHRLAPQQRHASQAESSQLAVAVWVVTLLPALRLGYAKECDVIDDCEALEELAAAGNLQ